MTYTPIPAGTLNWDVPVNAAFVDQDTRIMSNTNSIASNTTSINALRGAGGMPADYGLQNWSYDPSAMTTGVVPASGTIIMVRMWFAAGAVTALGTYVNAAGVTLTAGQNFMGLYDQAGNRIGVTADQTVSWGSIGYKQPALVTPATIPSAGFYYVAFLSNGATPAGLVRNGNITSSTTSVNLNLPADQARYASGPTGQTTLPTSVTMSARTPITTTYWMTAA